MPTSPFFSAVSDSMACGIVNALEALGTNCTGTSDILNFEDQLEMIRAFLPDASETPVTTISGTVPVCNPNVAEDLSIQVPAAYSSAETITPD